MRDDPPFRFGDFRNIIELAQRPHVYSRISDAR
jgi:hypothetical protein